MPIEFQAVTRLLDEVESLGEMPLPAVSGNLNCPYTTKNISAHSTATNAFEIEMSTIKIVVLQSFIGKKNIRRAIRTLLRVMPHLQQVFLYGTAGALSSSLKIGDLIFLKASRSLQAIPSLHHLCSLDLLSSAQLIKEGFPLLNMGLGLTLTKPLDSTPKKNELSQHDNADCVDLESAFAYAELARQGVPTFCAVRVITDFADQHTAENFREHAEDVLENKSIELLKLLQWIILTHASAKLQFSSDHAPTIDG